MQILGEMILRFRVSFSTGRVRNQLIIKAGHTQDFLMIRHSQNHESDEADCSIFTIAKVVSKQWQRRRLLDYKEKVWSNLILRNARRGFDEYTRHDVRRNFMNFGRKWRNNTAFLPLSDIPKILGLGIFSKNLPRILASIFAKLQNWNWPSGYLEMPLPRETVWKLASKQRAILVWNITGKSLRLQS